MTTMPSSRPPTSFSGRRSSGRRRCATSTPSRATCGRCGSAAAARSPRRGTGCRSSTSATSRRSAGPDEPVWCPAASHELDYELEVAALVDTPCVDLPPDRARGGDRWLHGLQRLVGARPAARGDGGPSRAGEGQGLRGILRAVAGDPGRAGRRAARDGLRPRHDGRGERRRRRAAVAGPMRSSRSARCSRERPPTHDCAPGDLIGSGTVGTGLPARGPGRDARPLPRARRRGGPARRAPRRAPDPDRRAARLRTPSARIGPVRVVGRSRAGARCIMCGWRSASSR